MRRDDRSYLTRRPALTESRSTGEATLVRPINGIAISPLTHWPFTGILETAGGSTAIVPIVVPVGGSSINLVVEIVPIVLMGSRSSRAV
jgi:hypothetical protein